MRSSSICAATANVSRSLTDTAQLTYRELADRVAEAAQALGGPRRLVLLETRNDISTLVHYLGALAAEHVVLPVDARRDHTAIEEIYAPDIVIDDRGVHHRASEMSPPSRLHDRRVLHDDLALLMSTSGSTGSPKLVRLSHTNLVANATVIAEYLGIRETDRAATTLPMSYCYGLSVIHSHLLVGAGLILTDLLGGRRGVLGAVPPSPCHIIRRGALHLRTARERRLRRRGAARPAVRHPGRRQNATRACAPIRRAGAAQRISSCS